MPRDPTRAPDPAPRVGARAPVSRCPWCGGDAAPVEVHGHVQCGTCRVNVDPCCGGETACPDGDEDAPSP